MAHGDADMVRHETVGGAGRTTSASQSGPGGGRGGGICGGGGESVVRLARLDPDTGIGGNGELARWLAPRLAGSQGRKAGSWEEEVHQVLHGVFWKDGVSEIHLGSRVDVV